LDFDLKTDKVMKLELAGQSHALFGQCHGRTRLLAALQFLGIKVWRT
jgi:hypothetical protein